LVITAVIYYIAVQITLPTEKITSYIDEASFESDEEEETLAGGHIG
jgi:hypothetical protein